MILINHIPNALTFVRLLLVAPFLLFMQQQIYTYAFYTFVLAGLTDGLDGWLARHFHWQSRVGSIIDPIADKLLIAASFISLGLVGKLPWWIVILVFGRDISILVGVLAWYGLIQRTLDFNPTRLSKLNTVLQLFLVTLCLFELAFLEFHPYVIEGLTYITAFMTTISFLDYVRLWWIKAHERKNTGQ